MKKLLYVFCLASAAAFGFGGLASAGDPSPDAASEYDRKDFQKCVLKGESWNKCRKKLDKEDPLRSYLQGLEEAESDDSDIWTNIFRWPPRGGIWLSDTGKKINV